MKEYNLGTKIKGGIYDVFHIWRKELKLTFSDGGIIIFFFIVPLIYPLLYAFIYNNETVREIPTIIVDESRSTLSREFIQKVDATPDVCIVSYASNIEEAKLALKEKKAYAIYFIPKEFSKNLHTGKQTHISLFTDMSALFNYKNLLIAATNVSLEMNKKIKINLANNTTQRQEEITAAPITYENIAMYNPQNGFASFLLPGVLMLIIQQTLLLGIGLSAGTAHEHNQLNSLIPIDNHHKGTLRVIIGKALCYEMIYAILAVYVTCAVPHFFSLPQIGQFFDLMLFILPYITACIFFAMTLSVFITNRENSMVVFVFSSLPILFISGISWPASAIPPFWKYIALIFPSTHGINGFVRINTMGATLKEVKYEYQWLWILTGIYFITTFIVYRWQLIRTQKKAKEHNLSHGNITTNKL